MSLINQPDRYGLIARSFHWLTAADITYDEARRAGRVTVTIDTTNPDARHCHPPGQDDRVLQRPRLSHGLAVALTAIRN